MLLKVIGIELRISGISQCKYTESGWLLIMLLKLYRMKETDILSVKIPAILQLPIGSPDQHVPELVAVIHL